MSELVLFRVLKLGARGKDVRAVKRGLARAGHGALLGAANPLLGPFAVRHLRNFQEQQGLTVDGEYGGESHGRLIQFFDAYARQLYEQAAEEPWVPVNPHPPVEGALQLPQDFVSTHQTAGLEGYPAIDNFAVPDTVVLAPEDGTIARLSGHDPGEGGTAGGPYGWSIYLDSPSGRYFMTHLATRDVAVGQAVTRGQAIGTVCDSAVSGKPGTSHVHQGKASK
jgi:peptidoglycan hydrolase-like protein with peptidoglycan-binding domain